MPRRKKNVPEEIIPSSMPPAYSMEEREDQLIAEAYNLVEQRILAGTASSTETVYFLRLGSAKEKMERKLLEATCALKAAQAEAIQKAEDIEKLHQEAMKALSDYRGVFYNDQTH